MHDLPRCLALLTAAIAIAAPASAQTTASAFSLACLSSAGTSGTVILRSAPQKIPLVANPAGQRISLSLSYEKDISSVELIVDGSYVTVRPGEGRILSGKAIEISGSMAGTVGKSVDYCLRLQ